MREMKATVNYPNEDIYTNMSIRADEDTFHCIFICPPQSSTTFNYLLPFIALDGTFLKTQFRQTLLFAVGRDLNNQILLLALAVVESEKKQSWRYFLGHLKAAIPSINDSKNVVISDRDKGLQAASNELDQAVHGWCGYHIMANFIKRKGDAAGSAFKRLARARDQISWTAGLAALALTRDGQQAVAYVNSIDPSKWALLQFPLPRFGHITSNIVEQMISIFKSERELPTVELLDSIWNKYMETWSIRYAQSQRFQDPLLMKHINNLPLTPFAHGIMIKSINFARYNTVVLGNRESLEAGVLQENGRVHIVNVRDRYCSCLKFQDFNLPCGHIISVLFKLGIDIPEELFDSYWVGLYQCSYHENVTPINILELEIEALPAPPPPTGAPGRPAKKRKERGLSGARITKRARAELDGMLGQHIAQGQKQSCGRCGLAGHNIKTCRRSSIL